MFLGHFGAALAAKRVAPGTSLATLLVAAQLLDLAWPALVLLGFERVRIEPGDTAFTPLAFEHYPWSHSLLMVLAWAAAFALAYALRTGYRRGAAVVAALVVSHWVLDLVTHRPDLPLAPGAPAVGLGLWNSVPATLAVEGALFAAAVWLYARETRAGGRRGAIALGSLVAVLVAIYAASVAGPPPPSAEAVASAGLLMWLFVPWAWWIDRARSSPFARGEPSIELVQRGA